MNKNDIPHFTAFGKCILSSIPIYLNNFRFDEYWIIASDVHFNAHQSA